MESNNLQALSLLKLIDNWPEADLELIDQTIREKLRNKRLVAVAHDCMKIPFDGISKDDFNHLINFMIAFTEYSPERCLEYKRHYGIMTDYLFKYDSTVTNDNCLNILLDIINSPITKDELEKISKRLNTISNTIFSQPFDYKMSQLVLNFLSLHKEYEKYFILVECQKYDYVAIYSEHMMYLDYIVCSDLEDLPRLKAEKGLYGELTYIYQVK